MQLPEKYVRFLIAILLALALIAGPLKGYSQKHTLADSAAAFQYIREAFACAKTKPKTSVQLAQQGLDISKEINWTKGIIKGTRVVGFANANLGNVAAAFRYFDEALAKSIEVGSRQDETIMLHSLSMLYHQIGDFDRAIDYDNRALKIAIEDKDSICMADVYSGLGISMTQNKLYDKAAHIYEEAVALFHIQKDTVNEAQFLGYIGTNNMNMKKYPEAYRYFRQSLAMHLVPNTCTNLGVYFTETGQYDSALYYFRLAQPMYEEDSSFLDMARTYENIAFILAERGDTKQAKQLLLRSLELVKALSSTRDIGVMEEGLAAVYAREKDFENAYKHHLIASSYTDSVLNAETAAKLAEYATRFEVREMEENNRWLHRKNELQELKIARKNAYIYGGACLLVVLVVLGILYFRHNRLSVQQERTELEQKQLRAQMNPHFIFNCLNSIQHFVVAGDVKNANKYLTGFALLMRQTLENSKAGTITLRREIAYLENYVALELMRYDNKFDVTINCAGDIDQDSVEIPAMIIQPFIENAIRHGLCYLESERGKLDVRLYSDAVNLYCEIDDNGIGRERSQLLKAANHVAYESHGMELTRRRLELVSRYSGGDYTIAVTDKKDRDGAAAGTCINIKFAMNL